MNIKQLNRGLIKLSVVAYAYSPHTQKAEAEGSLHMWGQPSLRSEFQSIQA